MQRNVFSKEYKANKMDSLKELFTLSLLNYYKKYKALPRKHDTFIQLFNGQISFLYKFI